MEMHDWEEGLLPILPSVVWGTPAEEKLENGLSGPWGKAWQSHYTNVIVCLWEKDLGGG